MYYETLDNIMSRVYFISDLHLTHRNILKFAGGARAGSTIKEHDDAIIDACNNVVNKNDLLWILGDIAFSREGLARLDEIRCQKHIILGNHDGFTMNEYQQYGRVYPGLVRYKRLWLSHCPIHPDELRGKMNVHGHVHNATINDSNYINVCIEALDRGKPRSLEEIKAMWNIHLSNEWV